MFMAVRMFIDTVGPAQEITSMIGYLTLAVILGALVYLGMILILWFSSGRPEGGEQMAIDAVLQKLASRRSANT